MSIPATVVPAYPYEGAIYWLLGEPTVRHGSSHPYYATLYGVAPAKVLRRAGALVALFDRIELASADHALPDRETYAAGDGYFHPDLRLSVSHKDVEWTDESDSLASFCFQTGVLDSTFAQHPFFQSDRNLQRHFLSRLVLQVRLAIRLNALLIGDSFFQDVYRKVSPYIRQFVEDLSGQLPQGLILDLSERTLAVTGLEFAPASFDAFAAIRSSKEIAAYASSFREAIGKSLSAPDLDSALLQLMKQALDSQEVSRRATSAIQTTGSVLNIVGLVPVVGSIASVGSIGADVAGRIAAARERKHNWYLLGAEMKSVALKQLLRSL
ncbi:hypothetical protein ACODYM_26770 [Burkholderia gladioli]|uniref:hypothetical protein n=1 Tax=Burkholderia gladioli TaxID=28095 RepID=UPI003B50465D